MNLRGPSIRLTTGAALVVTLLSGCGGSDDKPSTPDSTVNTAPATAMVLSGMVQAGGSAADVSASTGSELGLSGSTSVDAEGDAMTYKWTITTKPATSKLVLANATTATQSIIPDVGGQYVVTLRVTDSKGAFSEKAVTITVRDNVAPVTNVAVTATFNGTTTTKGTQGLNVGSSVVLDAKGSTDVDGDAVTTTWLLVEKPSASQTGLTVDGAVSRFVADVAGVFKVRARGTDALGAYSDTIYVFDASNSAPKSVVVTSAVVPGADGNSTVSAPAGYMVSMAGAYYQSDVTYAWDVVSKPAGSAAKLSTDTGMQAQISPDVLGDYVIKLTATSSSGTVSSHVTTIEVRNYRPFAAISTNVTPSAVVTSPSVRVPTNASMTLRSSNSVDADGDVLTYAWTLTGKPEGSSAAISAASGTSVQMTPDRAGTYTVLLRATDTAGAFSEQTMSFQAGSYAPVAVVDKSFSTVLLGGTASASASLSFDEDSGPLSYTWAIDSAPAASTAAIAAPSAAGLSFTPDVAGTYVASVTVSDGVNTNVAYVTIRALGTLASNVELAFAPLETRYSKGLDQLLMLATNPNTLKIVDPFTGMVKTVVLPLGGKALNLSPDGKLAAVLQDGIVTLVDVATGTILRSSTTISSFQEVLVNNAAVIYLVGRVDGSGPNVSVLDGRTGSDLSATLAPSYVYLPGTPRGVYSAIKQRAFFGNGYYSSGVTAMEIDTTGKVGATSSSSSGLYGDNSNVYLSDNHDLLFTLGGSYLRTDTLQLAGKLTYSGMLQSFSHSSSQDEALVMTSTSGNYPDYGRVFSSSYKRFAGALFLPDADLSLPTIGGLQSYGIQIFHSANGKHVALVQTGSATQAGAGAKYYVLAR